MRLALFDIDGTLTDTVAIDVRCLLQSWDEAWGIKDVDPDWSRYADTTDAGILREIFKSRRGRVPSAVETDRSRDHLVGLLRSAAKGRPFDAVRGARELLARLKQSEQYRIALAAGCWADSARVKMASAGMCVR